MRLRTFEAPTLRAVMQQVHLDMGSDAIIISAQSKDDGDGVVVRAALETHPLEWPSKVQPIETGLDARFKARLRKEQETDEDHSNLDSSHFLRDSIMDQNLLEPSSLHDVLSWHGLPEPLLELLGRIAASESSEDMAERLAVALESHFSYRPLEAAPENPLILIGAPGVGKTVTAAKLAASAVLVGGAADLITMDSTKAGGDAQCAAFADLLNQECISVRSMAELNALLCAERYAETDVSAIVDMPAVNPFDSNQLMKLAECLDTARAETGAEAILVMAASTNTQDACDMAARFSEIGARRLIITGIDVAQRLGSPLAAADSAGLALAQLSATPFLAEGLLDASAWSLAELLVNRARTHGSMDPVWSIASEDMIANGDDPSGE